MKGLIWAAVLAVFLLVSLAGCTHSQKLRSPEGKEVECKVFYWGLAGAAMAYRWVEDCSEKKQKQGYVLIKEEK
jgi:hypothetical protein